MARPAPPSDGGSPARLIATMVGIVGILLLGSLTWSAVGALVSAFGAASSALSSTTRNQPPPTLEPVAAASPTLAPVDIPSPSPTVGPTGTVVAAVMTSTPQPVMTPTAVADGRNPWILLPQPAPGAKVPPGPMTVEARGRGDSPITGIQLQLDGTSLPVTLEQRSESTWRGFASARVAAGDHIVRASVTDSNGRVGSYRWSFTAGSGP